VPPRADAAPIPAAALAANGGSHGAKIANGSHQRQAAPKPVTPPRIHADPAREMPLRDELARQLIERRLDIKGGPAGRGTAAIDGPRSFW
jgi:hypothetical protein